MLKGFVLRTQFLLSSFAKLKFRKIAISLSVPLAYFGSPILSEADIDLDLRVMHKEVKEKLRSQASKDISPMVELHISIGQHHERNGRFDEALEYYKKALEIFEQSSMTRYATIEALYFGLSNCFKALGNEKEGAKYQEKRLDLKFSNILKYQGSSLSDYKEVAQLYEKHGDLEGAKRCYEKILKFGRNLLDPNDKLYLTAIKNNQRMQKLMI